MRLVLLKHIYWQDTGAILVERVMHIPSTDVGDGCGILDIRIQNPLFACHTSLERGCNSSALFSGATGVV